MITYRDELAKDSPQFQAEVKRLKNEMMLDYSLSQLREAMSVSQKEIAQRMAVSQPAVSKIENGSDTKISTIARYVKALGGTLALQISLPTGRALSIPLTSAAL